MLLRFLVGIGSVALAFLLAIVLSLYVDVSKDKSGALRPFRSCVLSRWP